MLVDAIHEDDPAAWKPTNTDQNWEGGTHFHRLGVETCSLRSPEINNIGSVGDAS